MEKTFVLKTVFTVRFRLVRTYSVAFVSGPISSFRVADEGGRLNFRQKRHKISVKQ
jgi:hypothetical protein